MRKGVLVVLFGLCAACALLATGTPEPGAAPAAGGKEPRVEMSLYAYALLPDQDLNYLPIWNYIEEKTGVRIKYTTFPNYEEKIPTLMASGNLPDAFRIMVPEAANKYGAQGALVDIMSWVKKGSLPNFSKWMKMYPDIYPDYLSADGKMYAFPSGGSGETGRRGWLYRADIFAKNKLAVPSSYDELYTVLKKLKEAYPDTYPLVFRRNVANFELTAPQWGTAHTKYYDYQKKQWFFGPIEPNYHEMVKYFNRLYQEKLIPPDWVTLDTKGWQDIVSTSKSFVTFDYASRMDFFNVPMRKENPEFTLAYMIPPVSPVNASRLLPYTFQESATTAVNPKSKILDRVMKLFNWLFSEEGRQTVSWGKEGESYVVKDGKRVMKDCRTMQEVQAKWGMFIDASYTWFDYDSIMSVFSKELYDGYIEGRKHDAKPIPWVAFTEQETTELSTIEAAINKIRDENIVKFVLGTRDLSEWDAYVGEIRNAGLDKYLDFFTKGYVRQLKSAQ